MTHVQTAGILGLGMGWEDAGCCNLLLHSVLLLLSMRLVARVSINIMGNLRQSWVPGGASTWEPALHLSWDTGTLPPSAICGSSKHHLFWAFVNSVPFKLSTCKSFQRGSQCIAMSINTSIYVIFYQLEWGSHIATADLKESVMIPVLGSI